MAECILILGPCGAGKTTYARAHYPAFLHVDAERLMHSLFATPDRFRFYPHVRTCGAALFHTAASHLIAKRKDVCLTLGGATRKERALYVELAQGSEAIIRCIRLVVDAQTCIARAKADTLRPVSSRSAWKEVVEHWFRAYEPVDAASEGFASYQEVAW